MTKAQRSAAAKKAAATRKRNQAKGGAQELGRELKHLRRSAEEIADTTRKIAKTAGSAAKERAESELRRHR